MSQALIQSRVRRGAGRTQAEPHARHQRLSGWLLIALLCLMPVQLSWATLARYCQHESVALAEQRHAGHHSHEHQAQAGSPESSAKGQSSLPDTDCHYCHASVAPFAIAQYAYAGSFLPSAPLTGCQRACFSGWIPPSIERPKWSATGFTGMAGG